MSNNNHENDFKINSSDISLIIQGAVSVSTKDIIKTFRRVLPRAEIILSTWENQDASALPADKVIHSKDPGAFAQNKKIKGVAHGNNVNRQVVSSLAGLRAATRKYALKTRSDVFIEKSDWLDFFGRYDIETPPSIFNQRILICDFYSRNPRIIPLPFHWSDWVFFGQTTDLLEIFDIPLMEGEDTVWFDTRARRNSVSRDFLNRYYPEQWICSSFLRKHTSLRFDCFYDATRENVQLTERFFSENTVILDLRQWGIRFSKYNPNRYFEKSTLLHFCDWSVLYRKYCLNKGGLPWLLYLARCCCARLFQRHARSKLMLILEKAGIKETLRKMLSERNANVPL